MRVYAWELRYWKIEDFIPPDSYRDHNYYFVIGIVEDIREALVADIRCSATFALRA